MIQRKANVERLAGRNTPTLAVESGRGFSVLLQRQDAVIAHEVGAAPQVMGGLGYTQEELVGHCVRRRRAGSLDSRFRGSEETSIGARAGNFHHLGPAHHLLAEVLVELLGRIADGFRALLE